MGPAGADRGRTLRRGCGWMMTMKCDLHDERTKTQLERGAGVRGIAARLLSTEALVAGGGLFHLFHMSYKVAHPSH